MRILLADKLAPEVLQKLERTGATVHSEPGAAGEALTACLARIDPEVLVVRSTPVHARDVAAAPSLALIVRGGAGVNTIDLAAASARGIFVANCPGRNAAAVAELALGHLLNLDRRICDNVVALRQGQWNKKEFGVAEGLQGRTLAIIGMGSIGTRLAHMADALGMRVTAWSRHLTQPEANARGITRAETIEEAVRTAHAVSLHLALTAETRGCINETVFAAMMPGAYLINTARAELVDEKALHRALAEKRIRVGLDVYGDEPKEKTCDYPCAIAQIPGVYGTHHIGASTRQAEEAVGEEICRIVAAFAAGEDVPNCVNLAHDTGATYNLVVRHADRVGVLASVLDVLRQAQHNVQDMQNIIFSGGHAACARIAVGRKPDVDTVTRIAGLENVYSVALNPHVIS